MKSHCNGLYCIEFSVHSFIYIFSFRLNELFRVVEYNFGKNENGMEDYIHKKVIEIIHYHRECLQLSNYSIFL